MDNESDMDDFTLRLYIDEKVEEEACSSPECAEGFLENIAEFLDAIAAAHSYLDMEGKFFNFLSWSRGCIPVPFRSRK